MSDITIVTAFFDIGRGRLPKEKHGRILPHYQHRSVDTYFEFFKNLARLKNDLVVYTTEDFANDVNEIRKSYGLEDRTKIVVMPSYLPNGFESIREKVQEVMDSNEYISKINNPQLIEYWHPDYVLVNIFKSLYVTHAIESGFVSTDLTAWIDFGYCRDLETIPAPYEWKYDFDTDKIHFFNMRKIEPERPINDIIYTGDVYIQGCHIVAGSKMWSKLKELVFKNLGILLSHNLSDDDQTLLLMAYLTEPESFELRYNSPDDWFRIFKDYNEVK